MATLAAAALVTAHASPVACSADTAPPFLTFQLPIADVAHVLDAERAAWSDSFLVEHELVNRTRRITGSRVQQSVTWLHRHRKNANGAFERLEAAVLSSAADWQLAPLGPLHVRCIESIRYELTADEAVAHATQVGDEGWHQDEYSVLTAVATLSTSADMVGGELEVDRGGGPQSANQTGSGDVVVFRSWDAHRSSPLVHGHRHILVIELWQAPPTHHDATDGRPAELPHSAADETTARSSLCAAALAADAASAPLLWFCSQDGSHAAASRLVTAATLVASNAVLWELAAAALAPALLDELAHTPHAPSLPPLVGALRTAAALRGGALVADTSALRPTGWDEEEDGPWEAGLVAGADGGGGFFRQMSASRGAEGGFPAEGLAILLRLMAMRGIEPDKLLAAAAAHPVLREAIRRASP